MFDLIPYDCSLGVALMQSVNSGVVPRSLRMAEALELVVVVWGTSDVHFVDNVEIFSVGLAADAVTGGWNRSHLVVESCWSSYFAGRSRPPAFVSGLVDIQSYVADN